MFNNNEELIINLNEIKKKMEEIINDKTYKIHRLEKPGKILKLHNLRNKLIFKANKNKLITKSLKIFLIENNLIDFKLQNLWKNKSLEFICCILCYESMCPCNKRLLKCENCDCGGCCIV